VADEAGEAAGGGQLGEGDGGGDRGHGGGQLTAVMAAVSWPASSVPAMAARTASTTWR
jgi:hypothetical protein